MHACMYGSKSGHENICIYDVYQAHATNVKKYILWKCAIDIIKCKQSGPQPWLLFPTLLTA